MSGSLLTATPPAPGAGGGPPPLNRAARAATSAFGAKPSEPELPPTV